MNSLDVITQVRELAEKAHRSRLRDETRTLFATELVLQQMLRNKNETPPPWASEKDIQAFITDRTIHTQPTINQ